ncbi:hypothetical protein HMPREF9123_2904 [Neisseria bacilliformis ATCC BAA-1200]|uniref:Uncharacterized protein n=1 Tax=Neisseria bacilliformis ATCC BAA-1200 TaxID=888742 RepID=F2BGP7_9NEIS|nr:hypothetical protein HMPREF9123_2904 [Neisseria bacilliformis ATCC BAA-1200]
MRPSEKARCNRAFFRRPHCAFLRNVSGMTHNENKRQYLL